MHRHPSPREWERNPAGADPELEGAAAARELGEEVDGRVDDRWVEHLGRGLVVSRGDALVEIAVVLHGRNLAAGGYALVGHRQRVRTTFPVFCSVSTYLVASTTSSSGYVRSMTAR